MDRENCNSAAQFSIPQSKNTFVIQNATPFIHVGLNMHAKGHAKLTITILDVTQPLTFRFLIGWFAQIYIELICRPIFLAPHRIYGAAA